MSTNNPQLSAIGKVSTNSVRFGWNHRLRRGERLLSCHLQVKEVGKTWRQRIFGSNLTHVYNRKFFLVRNLPTNKDLEARFIIFTNFNRVNVQSISETVSFDTFGAPKQPRIISATKETSNSIAVRYDINNPLNILDKVQIAYSSDFGKTWTASNLIPNLVEIPVITFNSLQTGKIYIFKLIVTGKNKSVIESQISNQVLLPIVNEGYPLFDRNFSTVGLAPDANPNFWDGVYGIKDLPSPWKEYMLFAMEEWEKVIKISVDYQNIIKEFIDNHQYPQEICFVPGDPKTCVELPPPPKTADWYGIQIYTKLYNRPQYATVASARPDLTIGIDVTNKGGHFISPQGFIDINQWWNSADAPVTYTESMWKEVLVHELGHVLGIGPYWRQRFLGFTPVDRGFYEYEPIALIQREIRKPLRNPLTSNNTTYLFHKPYPNLFEAYDQYTGTDNLYKFFPLEHRYNQPGHPAAVINNTVPDWIFDYGGPQPVPMPTDIMSYGHLINPPAKQSITGISVGFLVDCGYELANTVIEKNAQIVLSFDGKTGDVYAGFSLVRYKGNPINYYTTGKPLWKLMSADVIDNQNTIVWRNEENGRLHYWVMNKNWEWVGSYGWTAPNSPEYYLAETNFQTDLNEDGVVGNPNISFTSLLEQVLESNPLTVFDNDPPPSGMGIHLEYDPSVMVDIKTNRMIGPDVINSTDSETIVNTSINRSLKIEAKEIKVMNNAFAYRWYCKDGLCVIGHVNDNINFEGLTGYNSLAECEAACSENPTVTPTPSETETPTETPS